MNRFYAHNGILQCDSGKIARHVWQAADRAQLHGTAQLPQCVNEVANYLKNRTAYADIFEGTTTTDIHRGQLETMLKKRVFDQYASLCRYEMSIGQDFYQYFIVRSDIDQIMSCARFLSTGHPGDYLFAMPAFFNQHTKLDLYALAAVNSFESLLAALEGTP